MLGRKRTVVLLQNQIFFPTLMSPNSDPPIALPFSFCRSDLEKHSCMKIISSHSISEGLNLQSKEAENVLQKKNQSSVMTTLLLKNFKQI